MVMSSTPMLLRMYGVISNFYRDIYILELKKRGMECTLNSPSVFMSASLKSISKLGNENSDFVVSSKITRAFEGKLISINLGKKLIIH